MITKTLLLAAGLFCFNLTEAQVIAIPDANFKSALLTASVENGIARDINQNYIVVDTNGNGEIEVSEAETVYHLLVGNSDIGSMAGVEQFTNLETLECSGNALTALNVNSMTTLRNLSCTTNQLATLDISGLINLESFDCSNNNLLSLNMQGCTALIHIYCNYNQLTTLDVAGLPNLLSLTCTDNQLTALDLGGLTMLDFVNCDFNQIETLNVEGCGALEVLLCAENQITSLDLSGCHPQMVDADHNQLEVLIIKNGYDDSEAYINFSANPPLRYLCVDDSEFDIYEEILEFYEYYDVVIGSYCSATPGGNYNTITGTFRFDVNGDGCGDTDMPMNMIRLNMNNGTESAATFSMEGGNYDFYTGEGTFTLTPEMENEWFTISPATATISFEEANNLINAQNFCIAPNGVHPDLEVAMLPLEPAQPGFDAVYAIVYRNKGNQVLSGNISLVFDDVLTDYISASPAEDSASADLLEWVYAGLMPFEVRSIIVTLNVNSPQEDPAVNINDVLAFTVNAAVEGDETPGDNSFAYDEIVMGSFDPNDITCLEGETETPERIGEYLHYNINFENTGTAPATFIVVKQEIEEGFDINSLQLLYASHDVMVKIEGNTVEYRFDAIDLGPSEKGNILFKIKTDSALQVGDHVMQEAEIFFDYNWPIETNEAVTMFEILAINEFDSDQSIKMYPNPTSGTVNITADDNLSIQLFDLQGRLLQTVPAAGTNATLDLSQRSAGVYLIRTTSGKGISNKKIVKQ